MVESIGFYILLLIVSLCFVGHGFYAIYAVYKGQTILKSTSSYLSNAMKFRNNFLQLLALSNFSTREIELKNISY